MTPREHLSIVDPAVGRATPAQHPQDVRRASPPELDHRVANSLQLAVDFLIFQQAQLADPAARRALIDAAERMVAVGHLHRFLCTHQGDHEVDLKAFLEALAALIAQSTGLRCAADADRAMVSGAVAQQLGMLVNELAINAAKHAYPVGQPGDLMIHACREGDRLRLAVSDRGVGLPPRFDPMVVGDGLGLEILRRITTQLKGRLQAETEGGARFTLTLPLPSASRSPRSFAPA